MQARSDRLSASSYTQLVRNELHMDADIYGVSGRTATSEMEFAIKRKCKQHEAAQGLPGSTGRHEAENSAVWIIKTLTKTRCQGSIHVSNLDPGGANAGARLVDKPPGKSATTHLKDLMAHSHDC